MVSGADQGFLERGFICIKVCGVALVILSHFSYISHKNEIIWSHRQSSFIYIGYLKTGDGEGGSSNP